MEPSCILPRPWTDVNPRWTCQAAQMQICQCSVSSQRCVAACRTQTSTGAWRRPHGARCCMKWREEKPEGKLRTISDAVMWPPWGTQRMNAASPVSVLAAVTALRHESWKLKPKERDNCHNFIFELFDLFFIIIFINALKYCFSLCTNFSKVEIIDWPKLPLT